MRFLIIDDNKNYREQTEEQLQEEFPDAVFVEVAGRKDFDKALSEDVFDIVLTDFRLRWTDGLHILKEVKSRHHDKPVIMFTDTGSEEIVAKSMKSGLDDYVLKKDLPLLPAVVKENLEKVRLRRGYKDAAHELMASEERFRRLVELFPDGLFIHSNGKILYVNAAGINMLGGRNAEEIMRKEILNFIHPDYHDIVRDHINRMEHGEEVGLIEEKFVRLDKREIDVEVASTPIVYQNKPAILSIVRDITDRKHTAEEVLESRRQVLDILESISDAFFALDSLWRFTYVNRRAEQLLGKRREELLYKNIWEVLPEAADAAFHKMFYKAIDEQVPASFEEFYPPFDKWFEVHAYPYKHGLSVYFTDITERKRLFEQVQSERAEVEQLAKTLEKDRDTLEVIMESTSAHIAYLDRDFYFLMVNSTYERGSGHTRDELIGRNHFEFFPNPENEAIFEKVRDTGEPVEYKAKPFEFADQPWRGVTYWDWTLLPVKDASGRVVGLVLSLVDITESVRAKQLSDALNDINSAIGSTLNFDEIMQRVVTKSAEAIGSETASIDLRVGNRWIVKYVYNLPQELMGKSFTDEGSPHAAHVAKTRGIFVVNDIATDPRVNRETLRVLGIRSFMILPLMLKNDFIGVLIFNHHSDAVPFTDQQIDFANKLAASISLALENVRLFETERSIADTLQNSLLTLPGDIAGIDFGYIYRSATEKAKVGGDFYDVFEVEHGKVGIIIGDVSGKGIEAAALTTVVRNTIKAHAYESGTPAIIMSKTNDTVVKTSSAHNFVTVFFGILDTETGRLYYCSAGHPPAIIKRAAGGVDLLSKHSPMIGAFAGMHYRSRKESLRKGDVLVAYTDGLIEARANGDFFGEARLVDLTKSLIAIPAKEIPQAIFERIMVFTGNRLSDDLALIAVSLEEDRNA